MDPTVFSVLLILLAIAAGLAVVVAWIVLPFIVMGLKASVARAVCEQQRTNELLEALLARR